MDTEFAPMISRWFADKFGEPTDVQKRAWPLIGRGEHTLISAPTGSGKTLAALLPLLNGVLEEKRQAAGDGEDGIGEGYKRGVRILYVTPLKALNNDIHQHLFDFVGELEQTAERLGVPWPGITTGVRTGDTSQSTRASMLRRPPDVLVTTPESLYILLTSHKAREMLRSVRHVVVDEIHDLAGSDRGMHLSVSLERLAALCGRTPQRIGVSATQKPPERIARYLGGWEEVQPGGDVIPRPVAIVESRMDRLIELVVTMPPHIGIRGKNQDIWSPIINELTRLMEKAGSTIVFVNSRRLCERLSARLNEAVGDGFSRSHHGSMSRERRLETEKLLREGKLRCLVATSSLELGIDVGYIDQVLQIDSPLSAASGIQRIGRSGHAVGGLSRGTIIVRSRGVLPELVVLAERIARRDSEEIRVPRHSLGVLAQQIVAIVATDDWKPDELYRLVQRSDSYAGFPRERFIEMLEMLSGLYPFVRPLIEWDRGSDMLVRRANTGMAAVMGAGTIPQSTGFPVYHAESRMHLGELDEEFIFESRVGDVFQLGTTAWRIRSIRPDRVEVGETDALVGEIPFWRADGVGRSYELSIAIGEAMQRLESMLDEGGASVDATSKAMDWLIENCRFTAEAADNLISLLRSQRAVSAWPTHRRIVIEWFEDETGLTHVVLHSWFGRKFNRTWLIALQQHLGQTVAHSFESNAKDNGIELIFREWDPSWLELLHGVHSETLEPLLLEAIPASPLFAATFRRLAETSLLFARGFQRTAGWLKRLRGQELLRDAMPFATKFPLVKESLRECLEQSLDLHNVRTVLEKMERGEIERRVIRSAAPSPLAAQFFYEFLNTAIYESDALTRDLQQKMMSVSRDLAAEVFGVQAISQAVDGAVLSEERSRLEAGYGLVLRERSDLLRLLKERGDLNEEEWRKLAGSADAEFGGGGREHGDVLLADALSRGDAVFIEIGGERRLISGDEASLYASLENSPDARMFIFARYVETVVAFTAVSLNGRYPVVTLQEAEAWIADAEKQRMIVPAPFAEERERGKLWSGAKAASRLIRATLVRSRGARADKDRYCALLMSRHYIASGSKGRGPDGVLAALDLLQGVYYPLSWWETIILPARVEGYRREDLDMLCASGEVFWLGRKEEGAREGRAAFFRREATELYAPYVNPACEPLHPALYAAIRRKGACFLTALSAETGEAPSELMPKLFDLVWQGLVANDQFAPLRMHGGTSGSRSSATALASASATGRSRFRSGLGRWYAVEDLASHEVQCGEKSLLAWTKHLLRINGVLTKPAVTEQSPYPWEAVESALGKMEEWGLAVRGLLVSGVNYLQYADKETADYLRQPALQQTEDHVILLSSVDPANPYGLSAEWPDSGDGAAFARKPGNYLLFKGGQWLLWIENKGRKISLIHRDALDAAMDERTAAACIRRMSAILLREHGLRKIVIDSWNGLPVAATPLGAELAAIGAEKDRNTYVIWPSSL